MNIQSNLFKFVRQHCECPKKGEKIQNITHVFIDAMYPGKMNILGKNMIGNYEDIHKTFANIIINDYKEGYLYSIAEQCDQVFNMFFDLDFKIPFKNKQYLDDGHIVNYIIKLQQYCIDFFKHQPHIKNKLGIAICTYNTKKINGPNMDIFAKRGVHLIMPELKVNRYIAKQLRKFCADQLDTLPETPFNNWNDIIDCAVYNGRGGLRLPFTIKRKRCSKKCSLTSNSLSNGCGVCNYTGYINEGSIYIPTFFITYDAKQIPFNNIFEDLSNQLYQCFIRTSTQQINIDPNKIEKCFDDEYEKTIGQKRSRKFKTLDPHNFKKGRIHNDVPTHEITNPIFNKLILHFIKFKMGYDNIVISKVHFKEYARESRIIINVNGIGSKNCKIKGSPHKSNTIWFDIYKYRCSQKCFDPDCYNKSGKDCELPANIINQIKTIKNEPIGNGYSFDESIEQNLLQFHLNLLRDLQILDSIKNK
jgi:hypothetical protein